MKLIVRTRRAVPTILAQLPYFHSIFRIVRQQSSRLGGKGQLFQEEEQVCAQSGLFDRDWYLQRNPDVAASGVNPLTHYISKGAAEGRDPHPLFDSDWYLGRNPDVAAAGINPLRHYIGWGAVEGRDPNPHFDSDAMAKIVLIHERYFELEYYEDRAVGTALFHYGIRAHSFDLFAAGILHDAGLPSGSREIRRYDSGVLDQFRRPKRLTAAPTL